MCQFLDKTGGKLGVMSLGLEKLLADRCWLLAGCVQPVRYVY